MRNDPHQTNEDREWYQTAWAEVEGSVAAPTASLHFSKGALDTLKARGILVEQITLHVGAGTFLPIKSGNLQDHVMHNEWSIVPKSVQDKILRARQNGNRIWALGTTATRALESWACGKLEISENGDAVGSTDLFIYPGFEFKVVDGLLTNFHQPKSTLVALVSAFAGREIVLNAYKWAIENKFRLFSYGDLTLWKR
jgi:S-adenosylmethionine:tRNA ribosyltransferase-isomerase